MAQIFHTKNSGVKIVSPHNDRLRTSLTLHIAPVMDYCTKSRPFTSVATPGQCVQSVKCLQWYRKRMSPLEGHCPTALLRAPLLPLLGVSNHDVLVETWIVMQSNARVMAKIHIEPERKNRGKSGYNVSSGFLHECFHALTDKGQGTSHRDYYSASENTSILTSVVVQELFQV